MSKQTPRHKLATEVGRISEANESGALQNEDFESILTLVAAYDSEAYVQKGDGETTYDYASLLGRSSSELPDPPDGEHRAPLTLRNYASRLRRLAKMDVQDPIADAPTEELNRRMREIEMGTAEFVKDGGVTKNSIRSYQTALRTLLKFDWTNAEQEEITMYAPQDTSVDSEDMYTKEEIQALREATNNPRNRALLEMLICTGQRIGALKSLKVKDIDAENGHFYLNDGADGLKGADKNGRKRPLLGAREAVRQWLEYHPCSGDDDFREQHLFTAQQLTAGLEEHGERLSDNAVQYNLQKIRQRAGVDKRCNAHSFRHYFVTVCKKRYDMDNDTIKALIGHPSHSRVMEKTYSHLEMDDHIKDAEVAQGLREPEETNPLSPPVCAVCAHQLPDDARYCPKCGEVYAPDTKETKESVMSDIDESRGAAKVLDDERGKAVLDQLKAELQENPEVLQELLEE